MLALIADPDAPSGLTRSDVAEPEPRPDEALVEMRASSLNRGEVRRLPARERGTIPGWDVAGVVLRPAADGGPTEGARVVGMMRGAGGAWAERAAVPIDQLAELPDEVSFEDAATLPVAGLTALRTLAVGGMSIGHRVLITGAAGGVGRFAIQLARRAGAHVTAVVGSVERGQGLEELGADEVVVGFEAEGERFDLILESAGGDSLAAALKRVKPRGTVVAFGNSSGAATSFDVSDWYGPAVGSRVYAFRVFEEIRREQSGPSDLRALADLVAAGELRTEVSLTVGWDDPDTAIDALMERRLAGKAVLTFNG